MEEKSNVQETTKRKSKLPIIIIAIVLVVVLIAAVGGYFTYQYIEENKTTGTEWGDTYYSYLEESAEKNGDLEFPSKIEDGKIQFVQLKEDDTPIMLVNYKDVAKENKEKLGVYYIKDDGQVGGYISFGPEDLKEHNVVLLYNRQTKDYSWYQEMVIEDGEHRYTDLDKYIAMNKVKSVHDEMGDKDFYQSDEYKRLATESNIICFKKDEMPNSDDDTKTSKFEETFIKVNDVERSNIIPIDNFRDFKQIKKIVTTAVDSYKTQQEVLTEEVKTAVQEKETKIEEIRIAKEEAEKKAKEEEEARKAAEEAAKGLKIGNHTIKYGTYKGIEGAVGETLVINPNGSASITANFPGGVKTIQMTYQVKTYDFAQDISSHSYQQAIVTSGGGYEYAYFPFQNDRLSDGGTGTYIYQGK